MTVSNEIMTLANLAKGPRGSAAAQAIIEIMSETNDILSDAPAMVCNSGSTHLTTLRDGIPFPEFRMLNAGTSVVRTQRRQIVEHTGVLENWTEIDQAMLTLAKDKNELLMNESRGVLEGISQMGAQKIFYGNMIHEPAGFNGLSVRYNNLNPNVPEARNVIDCGGTGANLTSIWIIQWAPDAVHLLFPEGTTAGVKHEVFSNEPLQDNVNKRFTGTLIHYYWYLGLAVRDWRRVVRLANVDVAALQTIVANGAQTAAEQKLMRQLLLGLDLLPDKNSGRTMIYSGRQPHTMLSIMASEKQNVQLTYTAPMGGAPLLSFLGVPIRRCDGLIVGEDQVVSY